MRRSVWGAAALLSLMLCITISVYAIVNLEMGVGYISRTGGGVIFMVYAPDEVVIASNFVTLLAGVDVGFDAPANCNITVSTITPTKITYVTTQTVPSTTRIKLTPGRPAPTVTGAISSYDPATGIVTLLTALGSTVTLEWTTSTGISGNAALVTSLMSIVVITVIFSGRKDGLDTVMKMVIVAAVIIAIAAIAAGV